METTENTQTEAVSEGLLDQDHQAKRHKVLIRDIQQESLKETPSKLPHGNPKKIPRKNQKGKWEEHNQALRNHAESSIHTKELHTRSSLPPDHPSLSQDLTMKLSS
jgi:hypothetical protein